VEVLSDALAAIVALVLISGAAELLVPSKGVRSFARFARGLLLMLAMLGPLGSLLSIEPMELVDDVRETMRQSDEIYIDGELFKLQAKTAAESTGSRVEVLEAVHEDGKLQRIELNVIEGDQDAALWAVCTALGLNEGQVVFR
jgi:stage III sporulation protein AF